MKNKITVSIPVYNGEEFILEALQSIVDQTHKVDRIIICDNQSTDNTVKIVEQFIKEHSELDIRHIINDTNIGVQKNLNKCMLLAQSDYLLILCADDILKSDAFEKQLNIFDEHPKLALVGGLEDIIDEKGNSLRKANKTENKIYKKGQIFEFVKNTGSYISFSTVLFNMKYIRRIGYFDENVIAPDEIFWPRVLYKYPIAILGQSLLDRRQHDGQEQNKEWVFKQKKMMLYFESKMNIANYESNQKRIKDTRNELKKFNSYHSMVMGEKSWIEHRKSMAAIKYWVLSFKLHPPRFFTKRFIKNWAKLVLNR